MAQTCDGCGATIYRNRMVGHRWLGVDCGCTRDARVQSCVDPYRDLTLQNIHDEHGKPVRVTSSRQLAEAEKRHNFSSVVLNSYEKNFDAPPQARQQGIGETYKRKFSGRQ